MTLAATHSRLGEPSPVVSRLRKCLRMLGPGVTAGASNNDPSAIATFASGGAALGLTILWAVPALLPMMITVVFVCAKIGMVSGSGLADAIKQTVPRPVMLLLLGGLLSGVLHDPWAWSTWLVALLAVAGGVMAVAFHLGRSLYFAVALVAAYVALVRLLFEPFRYGLHGYSIPLLLAALLGSAVLALIFWAHRRMRDR